MYSLKEEKISQITPFSVLADNKRIRNKIIDGKSTQATRSGKNILPSLNTTRTINGVTFTKNNDGSITINGTATANAVYPINVNSESNDSSTIPVQTDKTYTLSCKGLISGIMFQAYRSSTYYTAPTTFTPTVTTLGAYLTVLSGYTINNVTVYPQLEEGSEATEYEPYGASPSPEFPSEIKSVGDEGTVTIEQRGKNLINPDKLSSSQTVGGITITNNGDGTYTVNGTSTETLAIQLTSPNIIKLKANTYYTNSIEVLKGTMTGAITVAVKKSDNTIRYNYINVYDSIKTNTKIHAEDLIISEYSFYCVSGTEVDFTFRVQLEEGEEATDYEPYFSKDYVLPLSAPLRSLPNGTKDTIEEDGIHRRVNRVIFNGIENWYQYGSNIALLHWDNELSALHKDTDLPGYLCNIATEGIASQTENNNTFATYNQGTNTDLVVFNINTTVEEWKAYLAEQYKNGTPVYIDFELSEEVVEPFTDEQQAVLNSMETLEGVNYFSLVGDLQTTLTFDYNPKITEEIKRAFKYNITKAYLEVTATDKSSGFQINEDNYLQSIDFDDCRYIEGEGIIGSCVAKELQGKFVNVDTSFDIENRELECFIGAETEDNITHYLRLGTFIVQKPENDNVKDNTSFDSLDYMIKFNKEYVHRMSKYLKTKDMDIIQDKQYYILTESGAYEEVIVPNKEELSTYYEIIDEYTLLELLQDICEQCEVKLGTFDFRNANYVVHGNRFDTGTTCRDVLKAIAQAAFSWARINEYNELLLDFETSDTITEEIDYNEYYNLSFNDKYGPVNTIVLKNSQAEGENITVQDETLVKNYGIKELAISDNPFAYSEETRKAIIEAGKMLYGFTYVPLTVETIGAAYLNCKDKLKVKNMQDGDLETYMFDTRISYQGTLKSNVETLAMTDTETKYRYDGSLTTAQRRTEFRVDKAEQKINSLVKSTTEQGEKLTEAVQDLDGFKRTIIDKTDKTNEKITTIEDKVDGLITSKSVSGGQNLIKNSVGYFGNDYWQINTETEGKVLSENSTDVKQNSISGSALKIQAETIYQDIKEIKNGEYYLSFNYKRIINTAIATLKVNDLIINLTEENWKEEAHLINVTTNNIRIEITTDLNSSILITDLMLTEGNLQASWTQNANESYTDTVQIGKGVRITATGSDTEFVAEATGITINNTDTGGKVAEFTKYGTETQELVAHKDVKIADSLLIQKIGNQTWFSSL